MEGMDDAHPVNASEVAMVQPNPRRCYYIETHIFLKKVNNNKKYITVKFHNISTLAQ